MPQDLLSAVSDDLVEVHVGRGAAGAFKQVDDERIVALAIDDLATGKSDGLALLTAQESAIKVG
ncbi:hypothetical protein D9M69_516140 [compost metagenome]